MKRPRNRYTPLGKQIAALVQNQTDLAQILDLTQQSISGKLTGKIAVSMEDMLTLAEHFKIPMFYFFTEMDPEQSRNWNRVMSGSRDLRQILMIAERFPEPFTRQLLRITQALNATCSHYVDIPPVAESAEPHQELDLGPQL